MKNFARSFFGLLNILSALKKLHLILPTLLRSNEPEKF